MGWQCARSSLLIAAAGAVLHASTPATSTAPVAAQMPALQLFLSTDRTLVHQLTTVRHLEARNDKFDAEAWMDVRTDADATGFRYTVLAEGGSRLVRNRAFRATLDQERRLWGGNADRTWFTRDNYDFEDAGTDEEGLARVEVTPKRKDFLLMNGAIYLNPADGDLMRIEGTLVKSPSFWTRRVQIVRRYARVAGTHLPVAVESTAQIRMAGSSSFSMSYTYESINGARVE